VINIARPVKFDSAEKLEQAIDKYFADCEANDKAPTWASMLLYLNLSDQTLLNYKNNSDGNYPGYLEVIKRAEHKHCNFWQQYAVDHPNLQSFCMFELKQPHNGGFIDRPKGEKSEQTINIHLGLDASKTE
jgi:hypothetical protein